MTNIPLVPVYEQPPPQKTDPANFAARADYKVARDVTVVDGMNVSIGEMNVAIPQMNTWHSETQSARDAAVAAANFKGEWSSLSGALNIPASAAHGGRIWMLLYNVANVALEEPGVSAAWQEIGVLFATRAEVLAGAVSNKAMAPATSLDVIAASLPGTYARDQRWANGGSDTATNRRSLVSPNRVAVYINGNGYVLSTASTLDLDTAGNWDDSTYATPANRAGKDFYIYACIPSSGRELDLLLSANSTYPTGYTASNSRKIGGFHTLCVAVGTISGHPLSGYLAGDILPASVWCLNHRPACAPEGMVYSAGVNKWVDIYLASINAGELASRNGVAHMTGGTATRFHWYKFSQWLGRIGKRMLSQHEFQSCSLGSNQGTNIAGSANPVTTGGYSDTAGRRMISDIGCESCCGVTWQWGEGDGGGQSAASNENAFDGNDDGVGGQHFLAPNRPRFGGGWAHGATCGSRGAHWNGVPLGLESFSGVRGCAEPLSNIG